MSHSIIWVIIKCVLYLQLLSHTMSVSTVSEWYLSDTYGITTALWSLLIFIILLQCVGCPMDRCLAKVLNLRRHLRGTHRLVKEELDHLAPTPRTRGRKNEGSDPRSRLEKVIILHNMARNSIILWILSTYTVCINIYTILYSYPATSAEAGLQDWHSI